MQKEDLMKKSQVSIYIVFGLLILTAVFMLIYLNSLRYESVDVELANMYELSSDLKPVRSYVESCIESEAKEPIQKIGRLGGSLEPKDYTYYDEDIFNFLCTQRDDIECTNSVLTREEMEKQLSSVIEERVKKCVNLDIFRKQGFAVEEGELDIKTSISLEKVEVNAEFPLTFEINRSKKTIRDFSVVIRKPLGKLYMLATNIVNVEITKGGFDQNEFMINDGVSIIIEKHKPYPHTIYSLTKDDYEFNFALEGRDTVSNIGYQERSFSDKGYGCCYVEYDNNCYKNVPRSLCEEKEGLYDPGSNCECPFIEPSGDTSCGGEECSDCNLENGKNRRHGESWCEYDSLTGGGSDAAGSRHYRYSCIDGEIHVEECRDYREELCTETSVIRDGENLTKASCRVNRWENCQVCESRECCENEENGDCYWREEQNECLPEVPPGFKFWEGNGADVCFGASSDSECEGFGCSREWLENSAVKCAGYGDCGNYLNFNNEFTDRGFFHTNVQQELDESIAGVIKKEGGDKLMLPLNTEETAGLMEMSSKTGIDRFVQIMSSAYSFMDSVAGVRLSEMDDENLKARVKNVGVCGVWSAPDSGDCSLCGSDPHKPCTEYMCKSLGGDCIYEEEKGVGRCHEPEGEMEAPSLWFNESLLSKEYSVEEKTIEYNETELKGYKLSDQLEPHSILGFGINTDQEAVCSISYMPKTEVFATGAQYMEGGFSKEHTLELHVPPKPEFPQKILDFMNATNVSVFLDNLDENIGNLSENEKFRKVFGAILGPQALTEPKNSFVKLFTSNLKEYREASRLLFNKIEEGGYYLFFYCENEAGVINEKPMFLEVEIDEDDEDVEPPKLQGAVPENNTMFSYDAEEVEARIYVNEPSNCRYSSEKMDYEEMNKTFACSESRYDISSEFGGSYLCKTSLTANDTIEIFINCRDNPVKTSEINFLIKEGDSDTVQVNEQSLRQNESVFGTDNLTIEYFTDEKQKCSLSYSSGEKNDANCTIANNMEFGQYMCEFKPSLNFSLANASQNTSKNLSDKNVSANIYCQEENPQDRNTFEQPLSYSLERSEELKVIDYAPKGDIETRNPLLYVETNSKNVKCGYYEDVDMGIREMENIKENKFSAILRNVSLGKNEYYVTCRDDYGNSLEREIEFYVV